MGADANANVKPDGNVNTYGNINTNSNPYGSGHGYTYCAGYGYTYRQPVVHAGQPIHDSSDRWQHRARHHRHR